MSRSSRQCPCWRTQMVRWRSVTTYCDTRIEPITSSSSSPSYLTSWVLSTLLVSSASVCICAHIWCAFQLLLSSKMAASILSHSLSVISSLMDSAVDLASGFTLWLAAHQMRKSRPYSYPTGDYTSSSFLIASFCCFADMAQINMSQFSCLSFSQVRKRVLYAAFTSDWMLVYVMPSFRWHKVCSGWRKWNEYLGVALSISMWIQCCSGSSRVFFCFSNKFAISVICVTFRSSRLTPTSRIRDSMFPVRSW